MIWWTRMGDVGDTERRGHAQEDRQEGRKGKNDGRQGRLSSRD